MDLNTLDYTYIALAALLVGFSKTSVGGVGILAVLLTALAVPGKASLGVMLPMMVVADIFAVIYYRRHCQWMVLAKILPMTAVGIFIGYLIVDKIPFEVFEKVIGATILIMLVAGLIVERHKHSFAAGGMWTYLIGITAGIVTMAANAAGPVFNIFLLQMGLTKSGFVGTRSWYFLLLNIFKLPFSTKLGLITAESLKLNLTMVPVIFLGAWLGFHFLKMININVFNWLIRAAALLAAIRLVLF